MTVPCCLAKSTTRRENRAPFGAILCAARGQMCGWVKTHPYKSSGNRLFYKQRDAANAASLLRFERVYCRGEHCSPVPVCFARNCPGKCVAAPSRRAANDRPYTCSRQECGAQFSVTVMVPILVLSAVALSNAPLRVREAVPLGASSTAVPTAVGRSSNALSKLPVMPVKRVSAA